MRNIIIGLLIFFSLELIAQNVVKANAITAAQKADILYMYEEEKLARDTYSSISAKWKIRQFANIIKSEQTHMDALSQLAAKYSITLPNKKPGVFENQHIQKLYNELLLRSMKSANDAIQVGIDVEELDIKDLEKAISQALPDAKTTYENLKAGSFNHLSAFKRLR
jgi:hypothetical protein